MVMALRFKRNHGKKLDYLQQLGIDILVIACLLRVLLLIRDKDISDYYAIDPIWEHGRYGRVDRSGRRGISIIMDLVVNHCFPVITSGSQKGLEDPDGPGACDYFYFIE